MNNAAKGAITLGVTLLVGWLLGLGTGWHLWVRRQAPVTPIIQPAIHQADGSVVLETKPTEHPKPAQLVPTGAHVNQTIEATIHTSPVVVPLPHLPPGVQLPAFITVPGKDVTVDLSIVTMPNGQRRAVVSSPDGTVLKGMDIQEIGPPAPKLLKSAAGLVFGTTAWGDRAEGVFYDRDLAFARVGIEVTKNTYALANRVGWEVRGKVGIRF